MVTKAVQKYVSEHQIDVKTQKDLERLEQYALRGTSSFGSGSLVTQGWAISRVIRANFDLYVEVIEELYGPEKGVVIRSKREWLMRERPIVSRSR